VTKSINNKQLAIHNKKLLMGNDSNPLAEKSYVFALKIVKLYKEVVTKEKEFVLSKQLLRAGTSIGANVSEANGAISKADFSAKISIAYKESLETKYWLRLVKDTNYISSVEANGLLEEADELSKIMFSILKTTRINN
tara:strand:- start:143 stop:556 length:414 start_codon:yes stop_codon:yes gene_type:complete